MISNASFRHPLWMAVFLVVGFFLNLSGIPLFDLDEGAFSEATREMLRSGIWSATYLDGEPRYDKPILTYWLQAISVSVIGLNEWGLRLHSALFALAWAAAIYYFCRETLNTRTAKVAVLVFSTVLAITVIGRAATADAVLNCFIALTLFDIYRYSQGWRSKYLYRTWIWLSLGMLTKGPVAAVIPFIVSGLWFASFGQHCRWLGAIMAPRGWLITLVLLLPWLIAIAYQQGAGFFYGFLVEHNLQRFSSTREGHGGQWYYYLLILPLVLLPYSGLLITLLPKWRALWARPYERLLIIWFVVVFILVSASQTQLPHYILYGVTPLIILFAKYRQLCRQQSWQMLFPALFLTLLLGLYFYAHHAGQNDNTYLHEMLERAPGYFNNTYLVAVVAAIASLVLLSLHRISMWRKLVVMGLVQTALTAYFLLPAVAGLQQTPVKNAAIFSRQLDKPIVAYKINMPSFSVYRDAITPRRNPQPSQVAFTRADKLPSLDKLYDPGSLSVLYRQGGIVLVEINTNATTNTELSTPPLHPTPHPDRPQEEYVQGDSRHAATLKPSGT